MTKRTRYFIFGSVTVLLVGLCTGLVAFYTGMPMGAFGQTDGAAELQYVPADAAVVAYADVQSVMRSELRQKLHAAMEHGESGQAEFQRQTGIDIEHDIDRIVAYMEQGEGADHGGMVLAAGRFDAGRLEALARQHDGVIEDYHGKRLVSKPVEGKEHSMTVAFFEPGLVAVGQTDAIKRAIDRQGRENVLANKEMMDLIKDIDDSNAWAVGRFDALLSHAKLPDNVASQIPAVRLFSASGHINGGISGLIRAETRDEQAGQNLRDVVQGFLALARMQSSSQPELQALASSLQLSGTGKTVALSFQVPSQVIDELAAAKKRQVE